MGLLCGLMGLAEGYSTSGPSKQGLSSGIPAYLDPRICGIKAEQPMSVKPQIPLFEVRSHI